MQWTLRSANLNWCRAITPFLRKEAMIVLAVTLLPFHVVGDGNTGSLLPKNEEDVCTVFIEIPGSNEPVYRFLIRPDQKMERPYDAWIEYFSGITNGASNPLFAKSGIGNHISIAHRGYTNTLVLLSLDIDIRDVIGWDVFNTGDAVYRLPRFSHRGLSGIISVRIGEWRELSTDDSASPSVFWILVERGDSPEHRERQRVSPLIRAGNVDPGSGTR